jgi:hypothetical protein
MNAMMRVKVRLNERQQASRSAVLRGGADSSVPACSSFAAPLDGTEGWPPRSRGALQQMCARRIDPMMRRDAWIERKLIERRQAGGWALDHGVKEGAL